jgi:tetratricopeptide (TPR) repeat protein
MHAKNYSAALPQLVALRPKAPRDARVLWMLGVCNGELGRHAESIEAFEAATKADPDHLEIRSGFVTALQRGGRIDDALVEVERILYRKPNDFGALRSRASVLMDAARWDKAAEVIEGIYRSGMVDGLNAQDRIGLAITAARLAPDHRDARVAIAELEPVAGDPACPAHSRVLANWQLGRLYDKLKDVDKAFAAYQQSKELGKLPWDPEEHARRVDRLIECWREGCGIPSASRDGSRLVFILGMMRSGTSLTEQMIAQVPGVTPGGEMNAVSRQVAVIDPMYAGQLRPMPSTRARYTQDTIETMAKKAWVFYDQVSQTGWVTDKQPYNFYYVPLIARMFPGCRIVHCRRDPQDTCLSNFFQAFSRPHAPTHDLEWLGRYYRDYDRVMEAWARLPEVNMIDLVYEDLVADPRTHMGRVLEFIGMPWDEGILSFHESDRTVRTSSRDQVRQPLYRSSVKKHEQYAAHLGPLRRGLGLE